MREIVGSVKRVTDIMGEISAASAEQAQGVAQVGEAVNQMDQVTQQNAALVEQSAAAAESLQQHAQQLVRAVAVFKLTSDADAPLTAAPTRVSVPAPAAWDGAERRGPDRAKNVTRPKFDTKAEAPPKGNLRAAAREPAAGKTGTDDAWASF